ncbi:uncharacterized protein IAS62_002007 [Cryptococcus decagattii]|uniref:Required for respiratory growth protein 9, mitochondrial n=1 Tax=Cryptococcus decagattii TaxID=1859122 RepID=A0ABZ2AQD1_9TREE
MASCLAASSSLGSRLHRTVCLLCPGVSRGFSSSSVGSWRQDPPKERFSESSRRGRRDVFGKRASKEEDAQVVEAHPNAPKTKKARSRPLLRPPPQPVQTPPPSSPTPASPPPLRTPHTSSLSEAAAHKSRGPWQPTKKLTFSAMAGLRALHTLDPERFSRAFLSRKFGISYEAVNRILRSKFRGEKVGGVEGLDGVRGLLSEEVPAGGLGRPDLRGTKWDKAPETSERVSPVPAIMRAYGQSRRSR